MPELAKGSGSKPDGVDRPSSQVRILLGAPMKKQTKDKTFNLRMDDADRKRLEALVKHFGGASCATIIRMLVKAKYDELRKRG